MNNNFKLLILKELIRKTKDLFLELVFIFEIEMKTMSRQMVKVKSCYTLEIGISIYNYLIF